MKTYSTVYFPISRHFTSIIYVLTLTWFFQNPGEAFAEPFKTLSMISQRQDETVKIERERTRSAIERVTGDQVGELDDANTLGQVLTPELREAQNDRELSKPVIRTKPDKAPHSPIDISTDISALESQLPPLTRPDTKRWIRRPLPEHTNSIPVYTPDFSRQRLTLAALVGRPIINLPDQEISTSAESIPAAKNKDDLTSEALSLRDLIDMGLSHSPVMEQVQAQLDAALSRSRQSRSELLPHFSLRRARGPERSKIDGGPTTDKHTMSSLTVRLTQPIINIPIIYDWISDLNTHKAAEWRLYASQEAISLAVTNATVALATARLVLDFSDDQLSEFNELLSYIETRAQAGAASQADLERTRTRVLAAKQMRIEQQANYHNALLEIERLTGQVPTALQLPYLNQLPGLPSTQADIRRLIREYSYDLRVLRADIEAQRNTRIAEYSKLLPAFGVSLEHDKSSNMRGTNPAQTDDRFLAVLTWDFSLGGKEVFAGMGAGSELANRQAKLKEETERALNAADADFALLQSATLRVVAGQEEQRAAAVVVAAIHEQIKTGRLGSLIEALDAVERYFLARQRLVQTLGQQIQAQSQLLRRLGLLSKQQINVGVIPASEIAVPVQN